MPHLARRAARYLFGITFIAALAVLGHPVSAEAQSPPTGLVSINRLGNGSGNQPALNNALSVSADGRYVAFVSEATDLALNDANIGSDVFVRDRQTGQIILVSVNVAGTGTGNQTSRAPTITPDGRYVAFVSTASDLVTDDAAVSLTDAIFVRDLQSGTTTLVSRNFAGTARGNGSSGWFDPLGISADGRFVVFTSTATDLVATPDNNHQADVFVRDMQTHTTRLVSINRDGTGPGNNDSGAAVITPDGRFVAFLSQARDLIPLDTGFRRQVFIRDLQTGVTNLVTPNRLGTSGAAADTDSRRERGLTVSPDGRFVAFVSEASDLVDNDSNNVQDVFVRDTQLGVTILVSVNAAGLAPGNGPSGQLAMTPDGRFVAFISGADNLVANLDNNLQQDVFVRDLHANTTSLISLNRTGTAGGNGNPTGGLFSSFLRPSISDDGRYVSFTSSASDLTFANDTNGGNPFGFRHDVFVRDRQNEITTPVSVNYIGSDTGRGVSGYSAVARDGRSIFYFSGAGDLVSYDTNGGVQDLFVFVNVQEPGQVRFKTAATSAGENAGTVNVVVSLIGPATAPVSVNFSSADGTATSGTDYVPTSGTLTFAPGETEKAFSLTLIDDPLDENTETVFLRLSSTADGPHLGEPNISAVSIEDDDPTPALAIDDATVAEGDTGITNAVFTLSLSSPSGRAVTVQVGTQAGTATAGVDYQPVSGQVTFSPGQTTRQISVAVRGDTIVEGNENFFVNLVNPVNAVLADGQGVGTITNDDASVTLQFASASYSAGESERQVTVTVTRDGDTSAESFVRYATNDGAATERKDYIAAVGRLRFAPGETTKTFEVLITDDRFDDDNESFQVTLSGPSGATLGAQSTATVSITDDDAAHGPSPVKDASFNTEFFVRQHYHDFLGREPDAGGLQFWSDGIDSCDADQQCRKVKQVDTSAAFFLSIEFQETGFLVIRAHKAAFGDLAGKPVPVALRSFLADTRQLGAGVVVGTPGWPEALEANKVAYFNELVTRPAFVANYPLSQTAAQYVDALFARAGVQPTAAERSAAISAFGGGAGRAAALRSVAESQTVRQAETNKAFVLMQYFGYLRRNPDDTDFLGNPDPQFLGYHFWLGKLNQFNGNFVEAEMVRAFIESIEYGERFGQ